MMFFSKPKSTNLFLSLLVLSISLRTYPVSSSCSRTCDLALASYIVPTGSNLTLVSLLFAVPIPQLLSWNPVTLPDQDTVIAGTRINIPLPSCDCLRGEFLGHTFNYSISPGDTYDTVSQNVYSNLTNTVLLRNFNAFPDTGIPSSGFMNVPVNCSCGDEGVSKDYGLFKTWPVGPGDSFDTVAATNNLSSTLIRSYNPDTNFNGRDLLFVPAQDLTGSFRPFSSSTGLSSGAIAGIAVALVAVLLLTGYLFYVINRRRKARRVALLTRPSDDRFQRVASADGGSTLKSTDSASAAEGAQGLTGITVDKSVEFSYEELATATDDFSVANKIGQGGFGAVYYAELRGEKAAIKKMDMQATREFLAELKVLTHVHHLNLVRLIGYCVEGSLFLVYEFIENGNLSEHLRGSVNPLSWTTRVQIALDSARGLEYIHEHTVPVYIHRDIKSANILIDKNFHAKVADFGLTKLTEVGSSSLPTRLVGTFGYMPPEYAQYGDVSPKVDVYAFGVVIYELISAKEAIVKGSSVAESKGLVGLFEEVLSQPDPEEGLRNLVDPRLGDGYSLESVRKLAQLARACTHENPQLRPTMRSIVVALMTLSSTTEDWDVGSFYGNQGLVNLMSGR